mgnify:CR=1 FL=1
MIVGGAATGSLAYIGYPSLFIDNEFHYQDTPFNKKILNMCSTHLPSYRPAFLASGNKRQTLWMCVSGHNRMECFYDRHFIKLADGGTISVDWAEPKETASGKRKVCVIFPGLSGGSDKGYVKILTHTLTEAGFEVAVLHPRGFGNTEYTSPHFQALGSNEEFIQGLKHIKSRAKGADIVGVGMSAGACHMLRLAGDMKGDFPLKAMVSISNPFDFWKCINRMRGNVYERFLIGNLRQFLIFRDPLSEQEQENFSKARENFGLNPETIKKVTTWHEWDARFTAKVIPGFKSSSQYYAKASCTKQVSQI